MVKVSHSLLFNKISIKRSIDISGKWSTDEIVWAEIPLVTKDSLVTQKVLKDSFHSYLADSVKKYKMVFFSEGASKEKAIGDRLIIEEGSNIAFTSNSIFDELVQIGLISFSDEYIGQNFEEWAKKLGYSIEQPPNELPDIQPIPDNTIQELTTTMGLIRGKLKLIPAARDTKSSPGHRSPIIDASSLQNITTTSINRDRPAEITWEKYRVEVETLLNRRLEPNPSQILVKEGDLGLNVAQIGGVNNH